MRVVATFEFQGKMVTQEGEFLQVLYEPTSFGSRLKIAVLIDSEDGISSFVRTHVPSEVRFLKESKRKRRHAALNK